MTAKRPPGVCAAEGCDRPRKTVDWCHSHYEQWRRSGGAARPVGRLPESTEERFWLKVAKQPNGCWLWTGSTAGAGRYGRFADDQAHRWSYERFVGPIPDGLVIDHLCRVTLCVNPAHLEPVTQAENIYRGDSLQAKNRLKTHCVRGHEFTPENTISRGNGRICRQCRIDRNERRKAEYVKRGRREAQHGTISRYSSYKWNCRCELCRQAWRDYYQSRRAS